MAVTTAKIRAREAATGKKAYTAVDNAGDLHYAFDQATLQSILTKANNNYADNNSAKALKESYAMSQANNQWNAEQAQKQMDFQERMSNTSHQREVKDLIAAGLNPVLSANSGASSPAGASSSADTSTANTKAQMAIARAQIGAQIEMNKQNITSAQKMARWSNDLNRELGYAAQRNQLAVSQIAAGASMYSADAASSASRYGSDVSGRHVGLTLPGGVSISGNYNELWKIYDQLYGSNKNSAKAQAVKEQLLSRTYGSGSEKYKYK